MHLNLFCCSNAYSLPLWKPVMFGWGIWSVQFSVWLSALLFPVGPWLQIKRSVNWCGSPVFTAYTRRLAAKWTKRLCERIWGHHPACLGTGTVKSLVIAVVSYPAQKHRTANFIQAFLPLYKVKGQQPSLAKCCLLSPAEATAIVKIFLVTFYLPCLTSFPNTNLTPKNDWHNTFTYT